VSVDSYKAVAHHWPDGYVDATSDLYIGYVSVNVVRVH